MCLCVCVWLCVCVCERDSVFMEYSIYYINYINIYVLSIFNAKIYIFSLFQIFINEYFI